MMVAANISLRMGFINKDLVNRQEEILKSYNLPVKLSGIALEDILEAVKMDKKNVGGRVKWVLLESLGKATISQEVSEDIISESILEVMN